MLHQNEGGIGKSTQDFLRPEGNRAGLGDGFPHTSHVWWSTDILTSSIFLQGVDQKILPCGQGRIDSVKINPSLLMMRD